MVRFILMVCAGAVAGAVLGSTRSADAACCPLTATPWRGALYGASLAALAGLAFMGMGRGRTAPVIAASEHLLHITSEAQFERDVLGASGPVLVDFYADWCGPCQRLAPTMNELADELVGRARVAKVNVDEQQDLARKFGVSSIPDVRLFSGGVEVGAVAGLQDKAAYLRLFESVGDAAPSDADGDDVE